MTNFAVFLLMMKQVTMITFDPNHKNPFRLKAIYKSIQPNVIPKGSFIQSGTDEKMWVTTEETWRLTQTCKRCSKN